MAQIIDITSKLENRAVETYPHFSVGKSRCSAVGLERARRGDGAEGLPGAVLLIDGYVVGRLAEIRWLAGNGWRLTSETGRPPIEAPSLPALVREWLKQHGAKLPGLKGER